MKLNLLLLLALLATPAFGADKLSEAEQKIFEQEEKAAAAKGTDSAGAEDTKRGMLRLGASEGGVGTFTAAGTPYVLRLARESLLDELKKEDGKEVVLRGKVRVNNKYFIAEELLGAPPPPVRFGNKRGL